MASATDDPDYVPNAKDWRSLWGVLVVQTLNVFNDKITQFALIGLSIVILPTLAVTGGEEALLANYDLLVFFLISVPFVLFAPIAGWVSDRFSKRSVLFFCMVFQTVVLGLIYTFLHIEGIWLATLGFFLLSLQSTLLSPAKMGICKELVGPRKLPQAVGWMQMLVILSIIIGTVIGGAAFKELSEPDGVNAWPAIRTILLVLFIGSLVPYAVLPMVRPTPAQDAPRFTPAILLRHFSHLGYLIGQRNLRLAGFGVMFFWFAGGSVAAVLLEVAREVHADDLNKAPQLASYLNGAVGLGIALGSVLVSVVSRNRIELGLVPMASFGMAIGLFLTALTPPAGFTYYLCILFIGMSGAMYLVVLNAFIQDQVDPKHRGRITSAINLLNSSGQIVAVGFVWALRSLNVSTSWQFFILAIMALGATVYIARLLPTQLLRFTLITVASWVYRVRGLNVDRIPKEGGVLMISNHVTYVDAFIISMACPRPVRFVMIEHFMDVKAIGWFLRLFNVIPIHPKRAKDAIRTTAEAVKEGSVVCIFPEGQLTRTGMLNELKKGFELIVRQADCPVLPVYMDSLWGSIFSFERFKYFYKMPRRYPYPITVNFGHPIPAKQVSADLARAALQDLSVDAFGEREELKRHLGREIILSLKSRPGQDLFVEIGKKRRVFSRALALALTRRLANRWREDWGRAGAEPERVGILLPGDTMAACMHLAVVLNGRIPVGLPIELLHDENRSDVLRKHGIQRVIAARSLLGDEEPPEGFVDMREEVAAVSKPGLVGNRFGSRLEPTWLALRNSSLPKAGGDQEAACYLHRKGAGEYEMQSLTHRNLLASIYQVDSGLIFLRQDRIFVDQNFDSPEALILGLWYPALKKCTGIYRGLIGKQYRPSALIAQEKPAVVLLSSDLAADLKKEGDVQFPGSVRLCISFHETRPPIEMEPSGTEFCLAWTRADLGAIVSTNTDEPNSMIPDHELQPGNHPGSRGRLLPGVSARVIRRTGDEVEVLKLRDSGEIVVRGAGFSATTNTIEAEGREWIITGLEGSFDKEGFLIPASNEEASAE